MYRLKAPLLQQDTPPMINYMVYLPWISMNFLISSQIELASQKIHACEIDCGKEQPAPRLSHGNTQLRLTTVYSSKNSHSIPSPLPSLSFLVILVSLSVLSWLRSATPSHLSPPSFCLRARAENILPHKDLAMEGVKRVACACTAPAVRYISYISTIVLHPPMEYRFL